MYKMVSVSFLSSFSQAYQLISTYRAHFFSWANQQIGLAFGALELLELDPFEVGHVLFTQEEWVSVWYQSTEMAKRYQEKSPPPGNQWPEGSVGKVKAGPCL